MKTALAALCLSSRLLLHAVEPAFPAGAKGSVLIFVTTDCPVSNAMLPAVEELRTNFEPQGLRFSLVHVDPTTTEASAARHARDFQVNCAIVLDPKHRLARRLAATRTPEAVVLDASRRVIYQGRINDLYHAPGKRRREPVLHELRDALSALLAGKAPLVTRTTAVGCIIADFAE